MCRTTIVDNEDYTADLDYQHGEVFLHCDVHNYNKDVLDRMVRDWMDMEEALRQEGFDRVLAIPQKSGFVEYTGWDKLETVNHRGKDWEIYLWDLR